MPTPATILLGISMALANKVRVLERIKMHVLKLYFMNPQTGKLIIIAGLVIVLAGLAVYFFHDKLSWFGRLPGDIRIDKENFKFYFPVVTMLLLSLLLTIIINLVKRL